MVGEGWWLRWGGQGDGWGGVVVEVGRAGGSLGRGVVGEGVHNTRWPLPLPRHWPCPCPWI